MVGKKRISPSLRKVEQDGESEDDVLFLHRKIATTATLKRKNQTKKDVLTLDRTLLEAARNFDMNSETVMRHTKMSVYALNEVIERCIMEFLPVIPNRLHVEAVCRRWRRLSLEEMPVTELDFEQVALRPLLRRDVRLMLERAKQQLTKLVLPDITLADAHIELIVQQQNLRVFRAHRMQKRHFFNILEHCASLQTLELMDCRALRLSGQRGWPRDAVALREVYLNECHFFTNQAARSLIKICGSSLEKVVLTGAMSLDSQVLRDLATYSVKLAKLTISSVNLRDIQTMTEGVGASLRWLDLSSCRDMSSFPVGDSTNLLHLQVLMLDKTKINDDGLRAIARVAPSLQYLSLQNCRVISDDGLATISEGCTNLELVDLKGTAVTDASIKALEAQCPRLRLVRVDSCRSVSREMRWKYNERALRILKGVKLSKLRQSGASYRRRR
ncbi:unnamed protein product [Peronospora effusa]|nr:unnamed protein product [Peronospora effusa]